MKNVEEMVLKMEKHSTHVIFVMGADKQPLTKVFFFAQPCSACKGQGNVIDKECKACRAQGS